jgi:hypothetical protein
MSRSDPSVVVHTSEPAGKGGRKKKYLKVAVFGSGSASEIERSPDTFGTSKLGSLPHLMKLSELPKLLGMSRASVYRMSKQGLKTSRPTGPNGDQHVSREDLITFFKDRQS